MKMLVMLFLKNVYRQMFTRVVSTQPQNSFHEGYCAHLFPDRPVSRNYKTEERLVEKAVKSMLEEEFPHILSTFNKSVSRGCSKKRPDTFVDAFTHVIFGKVDKEQHNTKDYCYRENQRTMRYIIFVRLNPNSFTNATGIKHSSYRSRKFHDSR